MFNIRNCYCLFFLLITIITGEIQAISWSDPAIVPAGATEQEKAEILKFNNELNLAWQSYSSHDYYGMTDHLQEALRYRPVHPDNIKLEFWIGVAMSQYRTPGDTKPLRNEESRKYFKNIVETYNHSDYFTPHWDNAQSIEHPSSMVIQSCIYLASGLMVNLKDYAAGRQYTTKALDCIFETFTKRQEYWRNQKMHPKRQYLDNDIDYQRQSKCLDDIKEKARKGDIFCIDELNCAKICVRNYGVSAGENQTIADVIVSMNELIEKYPDSPISKIAATYIDNAKKIELDKLDKSFFDDSLYNAPIKPAKAEIPGTDLLKEGFSDEIFVPRMSIARKIGKPYMFFASRGNLVDMNCDIDSKEAEIFMKQYSGAGLFAWDGCVINATGTAIIFNEKQSQKVRKEPGQVLDRYYLTDIEYPYSFNLRSGKNDSFTIVIVSEEEIGIYIRCRKEN